MKAAQRPIWKGRAVVVVEVVVCRWWWCVDGGGGGGPGSGWSHAEAVGKRWWSLTRESCMRLSTHRCKAAAAQRTRPHERAVGVVVIVVNRVRERRDSRSRCSPRALGLIPQGGRRSAIRRHWGGPRAVNLTPYRSPGPATLQKLTTIGFRAACPKRKCDRSDRAPAALTQS